MDTITPFVHEFTYQAMAYDLLELQNDEYKYAHSLLSTLMCSLTYI